ncbi:extracellular solute-binding protein [Micromonospora globbae]|jgi:iron(III) transport system substrate-binding protein|uniref:Extracellular solute-binding protein n=1 Tax=Micromonospora globbae TaxID=1894969 RepID=A0A420F092_9ACTN|nr:extracellular solute-binding protein [Micromonospora globbae]RKF26393.1 extracellular solute-binding protein [Micromonospora globbae]WTF83419.1 extracellular solute-binding protein [Micromonospora globbae]
MKRRLLFAGALAAVLAAGTACGGGGDDAGGSASAEKLTIYTARDKKVATYVVDQFTAKYPEYKGKVEILNLGAQEILERVRAEKANPQADVWWGGTQQGLAAAATEDLLAPIQPAFAAKMDPKYKDPEGRWFGEILLPEVIMYNNKALTPEQAPKDWDDLIKPEWKDKIIIRDVAASGTMRSIYASMIQRLSPDGSNPEPGYEWLRKLDANTGSYTANPTDLYLKMSRQQGVVSAWNLQDILLQANQANMPFGYVMPASGAPVLIDGLAAVKGGNTTGAQKFLEFLFDDKLRADLAKDYFQIPAVDIAEKPEWLAQLQLKPMDVDWDVVGKHETEWINHWNSQIKNKG